MEHRIESYPAFTVVGIKSRHRQGADNSIPKLWETFVPRMNEVSHRVGHESYGVMGNYDHATGEFDYLAGVPVTDATDLPKGMTHWPVPTQTYAVFPCTLQTIHQTFQKIDQKWLTAADLVRGDGPEFELYDEQFNPEAGKFELTIWIPIRSV